MGDSCLPENRAIEPFASSTPVLAQEGRLGQAADRNCSGIQCAEGSGSAMVTFKQKQPGAWFLMHATEE